MEKAALLIIDMQNRWIGPGKELVPAWTGAVSLINRLRDHWAVTGQPVFFVSLVHESDGSTISKFDSVPWNIRGSLDAQIIKELTPRPNERLIEKHRYSAFFGTGLAELMEQEEISACALTGYQARACILATALDAYQYDLQTMVVSGAVLDTDKEHLDFALRVFAEAEVLKTEKDVLNLW